MIYIAANGQEGRRTGLKEVTKAINSPEAFTAKILQQLVKGGLLESFRGPTGGFTLPAEKEITLYDIVNTIDGQHLMQDCVLGLPHCSEVNPCPVHEQFISIRTLLNETLINTQVKNIDLKKGKQFLKT